MAGKNNHHVYIEEGELRQMRDPRTGQLKEVDLSTPALSRTMENIRKSAEIINQPNVSFDMAMGRFEYIRELVLDHAQFSPRLQNLQIKILDKTIEVVREVELLDKLEKDFARKHYLKTAREMMSKTDKKSGGQRITALRNAIDHLTKGLKYAEDNEEYNFYLNTLKQELG